MVPSSRTANPAHRAGLIFSLKNTAAKTATSTNWKWFSTAPVAGVEILRPEKKSANGMLPPVRASAIIQAHVLPLSFLYSARQLGDTASGIRRMRPTSPSFKAVYSTGSENVLTPRLLM
jgi:hypothetical protein